MSRPARKFIVRLAAPLLSIASIVSAASLASPTCIERVAHADDPLGPSRWAVPTAQSPSDPPARAFREYTSELQQLLVSNSLDQFKVPRNSPGRSDEPKREVVVDDHFRLFLGIALRKTGSTEQLVGAVGPNDTLLSTYPGVIGAARIGFTGGPLTMYGLLASGAVRVLRYDLPLQGDESAGPVSLPGLMWSGMVMGGVGGELRIYRSVKLGVELDYASLTATAGHGVVIWPDPSVPVRTAIGSFRFEY